MKGKIFIQLNSLQIRFYLTPIKIFALDESVPMRFNFCVPLYSHIRYSAHDLVLTIYLEFLINVKNVYFFKLYGCNNKLIAC